MTGISFFSFNGKSNPNVIPLQGKKRPAWAPLERTFLEVPHYPGGRLIRTQTKMRKIIVPVSLFYESMEEAEKLKEEIANWLITDQPQELIFDDEKDRTYLAVIDESFDPQQLVNLGEGVLTFICEMPYKLGPTRTIEFQANERGLVANIQNKGSLESNPIIEIEVTKPATFLDVWNGDNYFRIGWPLRMDQVPVERNQRVMWDEMSTTIGWTDVPNAEDMVGGGAFKVDAGSRLVPVYLGETNIKGWHGCIAKKNIPQGPLQDFIMQAYVGVRSSHPDQMGRVEIGLLDENSDYVARISMNDVHWQAEQNTGFAKLGNKKKPAGERVLINEPGDHPTTWNQYRGRLWLARTGNRWEAYISKFLWNTEKDDSERFVVWEDENNVNMDKVAQVQISISQFSDNMFCTDMSIDDLKIWKVNMNTQDNPPYIFDVGDKVVIDTERSLVSINGRKVINLKDIFSDYPVVRKGSNKLEIMPSDVGIAKVTYRERYR
ncbi:MULTISPECIES: distal tail protein Dit [Bacillus cereus group]|jgi:predicted phage tail component-like protein|uniref:distal tail protein Dit n=1 Tax=Bacillus cereus group TaxID=86661 RepID=UPI0015810107|nr:MULTISPECIES: distal tail protein Dit [Bacillus cereus group]MDA2549716.1 phage tail family protein [Bacillus cereus]MDA2555124.1 phage tail family protein [Bacillus cereus]MDW8785392.1 phage tail family protein [Bacillus cereus]MDZ4557871.1 phage tail family protein [Bacillus cereus]NUH91325.1 phage tail family protein [Bacillus thuringiensis]